ncbi:DUF2486 family protein [Paraburkholderia sp. IMGN_8]|uniref:DUF2486 family protein n=1 Tax=Paraburkholderia sp. IMGN_8 TaxID=3136564 RepID=UPI003100FB73
MSDPHDKSIPVLHEILVQGDPAQARHAQSDTAAPSTQPAREPATAQEPTFVQEPTLAPEPAHATEPTLAPQPHVRAKKPHKSSKAIEAEHGREPAFAAPSAGVFDRAEPRAPIEAGAVVPPDFVHEAPAPAHANLDADAIAERLRGRFASFLTGEGRGLIEARCRDALQEHTAWLVNQITREVALTLEAEMTGWAREAVEEEIARRSGSA